MRFVLPPEPLAGRATWARRLACAAAVFALVAVAFSHRELIEPRVALLVLGSALTLACLALLNASIAAAIIWRTGQRGVGRAMVGVALALLVLAYPSYVLAKMSRAPLATDLSTSPDDPPRFAVQPETLSFGFVNFSELLPARSGKATASPVEPLMLDAPGTEAFLTAVKVVKGLRWRVIDTVPPGKRAGAGHIGATAFSAVMHLPEAVAIRVVPMGGQSRIDVRSASRLGLPDTGDNLRNVEAVLDGIQDLVEEK